MTGIIPHKLKKSETVERKEALNARGLKTLSAFSNTKGGSLYIGIKDDSKFSPYWCEFVTRNAYSNSEQGTIINSRRVRGFVLP